MTLDALFELDDTRPCAALPARCTTCPRIQCLTEADYCNRCDRVANLEVCVFTWHKPRRTYVVWRWLLTCWWHTGDTTDQLRVDVLEAGPAYLIRWTAKPWGIVAGGTRAHADVEQVAA